jgi:hypothetical protein
MPLSLSLRNSEDWRSARTARRYMLQAVVTPPTATANTNLVGLRKLAINPDIYISRIRVHLFHVAAITAVSPLGWKRAATVAGGGSPNNPMTLADIPKNDTAAVNATLEVRMGAAVTGTKANQYILTHPAPTTAAPATTTGGGFVDDWTARDLSERIRLTADEGLILELMQAFDTDLRVHLLMVWEEVA